MSTGNQLYESSSMPTIAGPDGEHWYAVHTRARHERVVAHRLLEQGVNTFLPLVTEVHRWSDRKKSVELPLFGCYVFVKLAPTGEERLRVLRIDGVFKFVGARGLGTPIAESQIEAVRTLIRPANTLECPSISSDRTARASAWRSHGWSRRYPARSQ